MFHQDGEPWRNPDSRKFYASTGGCELINSCNNDEAFISALKLLMKCLLHERSEIIVQNGIIEGICELIVLRCNFNHDENNKKDTSLGIRKGKDLLYQTCKVLKAKLSIRAKERNNLIEFLLYLAGNRPSYLEHDEDDRVIRGVYIPALIIARDLYFHESRIPEAEFAWSMRFYKIYGRLIFAMMFNQEDVVPATEDELEFCKDFFAKISELTFDKAFVAPLQYKLMEDPNGILDTLIKFISILRKSGNDLIFEDHIYSGLKLPSVSVNLLCSNLSNSKSYVNDPDDKSEREKERLQLRCIDFLSSLIKIKYCQLSSLVIISEALIEELKYRSTNVKHRMIFYMALEECATVAITQEEIKEDNIEEFDNICVKVVKTLKSLFNTETSLVKNQDAIIGCEAVLEAWALLMGEEYQPEEMKKPLLSASTNQSFRRVHFAEGEPKISLTACAGKNISELQSQNNHTSAHTKSINNMNSLNPAEKDLLELQHQYDALGPSIVPSLILVDFPGNHLESERDIEEDDNLSEEIDMNFEDELESNKKNLGNGYITKEETKEKDEKVRFGAIGNIFKFLTRTGRRKKSKKDNDILPESSEPEEKKDYEVVEEVIDENCNNPCAESFVSIEETNYDEVRKECVYAELFKYLYKYEKDSVAKCNNLFAENVVEVGEKKVEVIKSCVYTEIFSYLYECKTDTAEICNKLCADNVICVEERKDDEVIKECVFAELFQYLFKYENDTAVKCNNLSVESVAEVVEKKDDEVFEVIKACVYAELFEHLYQYQTDTAAVGKHVSIDSIINVEERKVDEMRNECIYSELYKYLYADNCNNLTVKSVVEVGEKKDDEAILTSSEVMENFNFEIFNMF